MSSMPSALTCARPAAVGGDGPWMGHRWNVVIVYRYCHCKFFHLLHHKLLQICATSSMAAYVLWLWSFRCGTSQRWSGINKSIQQSETKSIRKDTQGLFLVELTIAYPFSPALQEVVFFYNTEVVCQGVILSLVQEWLEDGWQDCRDADFQWNQLPMPWSSIVSEGGEVANF